MSLLVANLPPTKVYVKKQSNTLKKVLSKKNAKRT